MDVQWKRATPNGNGADGLQGGPCGTANVLELGYQVELEVKSTFKYAMFQHSAESSQSKHESSVNNSSQQYKGQLRFAKFDHCNYLCNALYVLRCIIIVQIVPNN